MSSTLGILVNTDRHLDYVVALARAASRKGIQTRIFFTGRGVLLTQKQAFADLVGLARLAVCEVSFRANHLSGDVPGVGFKDFVTQAVHAEMVAECERYLVM